MPLRNCLNLEGLGLRRVQNSSGEKQGIPAYWRFCPDKSCRRSQTYLDYLTQSHHQHKPHRSPHDLDQIAFEHGITECFCHFVNGSHSYLSRTCQSKRAQKQCDRGVEVHICLQLKYKRREILISW